jgi:hypothetical protein
LRERRGRIVEREWKHSSAADTHTPSNSDMAVVSEGRPRQEEIRCHVSNWTRIDGSNSSLSSLPLDGHTSNTSGGGVDGVCGPAVPPPLPLRPRPQPQQAGTGGHSFFLIVLLMRVFVCGFLAGTGAFQRQEVAVCRHCSHSLCTT